MVALGDVGLRGRIDFAAFFNLFLEGPIPGGFAAGWAQVHKKKFFCLRARIGLTRGKGLEDACVCSAPITPCVWRPIA
jgi:hypothetical protein